MKKLLFLALLGFIAASCDSDVHLGDRNDHLIQSSGRFTVKAREWEYVDVADGPFYRASVSTDLIDNRVCKYGDVDVYFYDEEGYQIKMPNTRHYLGYDPVTNTEYIWSRTIDFAISPGWLDIFVTDSDFPLPPRPIPAMDFRFTTTGY